MAQFLKGTTIGKTSFKRVAGFVSILLFVIVIIANLFFGKELKVSLEDDLFYIILASLGLITAEPAINKIKGSDVTKSELTLTKVEEK